MIENALEEIQSNEGGKGKKRGYHDPGVFSISLIQDKWKEKVRRHSAI